MRRSFLAPTLAAGLLTLGACATLGEPVTLNMAELDQRCERRGGTLQPTGAQSGRPQTDFICQAATDRIFVNREPARTSLNTAINQSLARGN
jgi:hypothetical protein